MCCKGWKLWFSGFFGALAIGGFAKAAMGQTVVGNYIITSSTTVAAAVVTAVISIGFYYADKKRSARAVAPARRARPRKR